MDEAEAVVTVVVEAAAVVSTGIVLPARRKPSLFDYRPTLNIGSATPTRRSTRAGEVTRAAMS